MRYLHTMIRVRDLKTSIAFYRDGLGMKLLRQRDYEGGRFTLAFLGYEDNPQAPQIELTHNWDQETPYQLGDGWGHIALGVDDIHTLCAHLETSGARVVRQPGPMKHGTTVIAFVRDPDDYSIELIQQNTRG